jgi:hypothetical protein
MIRVLHRIRLQRAGCRGVSGTGTTGFGPNRQFAAAMRQLSEENLTLGRAGRHCCARAAKPRQP